MDLRLYEMHAGVCAALAHPKRIQIIDLLKDSEKAAGVLAEKMGIPKANLSQHLQVMKGKGILRSRRDGVRVTYRVVNPKIVQACKLMREVVMERLEDMSILRNEYKEGSG